MADLPILFRDLVRLEIVLWNAVEARLVAECTLPLGRFEVLQVIGASGPCRVGDISDELEITWGGTSKIVDRLEASGLCRRRPNPDDKRSSLITLTKEGERLLVKAQGLVEDELARRLRTTSARGLDQFAQAVSELKTAVQAGVREEQSA
jgi:DNA-binding MarR family transcriptional regulator